MTTLEYKGYRGQCVLEDDAYVIELIGIDGCVTTRADSAGSAQVIFEHLVDDYLKVCGEISRKPG